MSYKKSIFLLILILSFSTQDSNAQLERNTSFTASGQFNFGLHNFGTDDNTGLGFSFEVFLLGRKKLGISIESSGDYFFGDKSTTLSGAKSTAKIIALRAGPYLFLTNRLFLAALYGYGAVEIYEWERKSGGSFKMSAGGFLGSRKNIYARVYFIGVNNNGETLSYFGISVGYKMFESKK